MSTKAHLHSFRSRTAVGELPAGAGTFSKQYRRDLAERLRRRFGPEPGWTSRQRAKRAEPGA